MADEARCMDLADRYVNSECVKRMLQADQVWSYYIILSPYVTKIRFFLLMYLCICVILQLQVALAEKTAVLFTKDGEQHNNLHDMQCMWCVSF